MNPMRQIGDILFPPRCIFCRELLGGGEEYLCGSCRKIAPFYGSTKSKPQFLDSFTAVWYYEGCVRASLHRFKFYGGRELADSYGRFLAQKLREEYPQGFDVITWVPVSFLRRLRRGYDQGYLIARATGRALGQKPLPLLRKIRHNSMQSHIQGAAQRRANVSGVYRATDPARITGKRILLLDDILTTGATAGEAARILRTAGAAEVHCAAVAAARKE